MKIKELIRQLQKHNPEARVFLSSDEEGNSYGDVDTCLGGNGEGSIIIYPTGANMYDYDDICSMEGGDND